MKKIFIFLILLIFQFVVNVSFAVDLKKCENVFDPIPNNTELDNAFADYIEQIGVVIGSYYSLYSVKEEKCPSLIDEIHHLKKGIIYSHINLTYPTNILDKKLGIKKCLLSHFEKDDKILDENLKFVKNSEVFLPL